MLQLGSKALSCFQASPVQDCCDFQYNMTPGADPRKMTISHHDTKELLIFTMKELKELEGQKRTWLFLHGGETNPFQYPLFKLCENV